MKTVVVRTDNSYEACEIGSSLLEDLQSYVNGYIEIVRPVFLRKPYVMVVNECGLLHHLDLNEIGSILYGYQIHCNPIVGDVVFVKEGLNDAGEPDLLGLTDHEASVILSIIEVMGVA